MADVVTKGGLTQAQIDALRDKAVFGSETKAERKKMGRPSDFTKARVDKIIEAIELGNSVTTAAMLVGVSRAVIFNWLDRGKTLLEALKTDENHQPAQEDEWDYLDFLYRYWQAQGSYSNDLTEVVAAGALTDPELALRILALKQPEEWGGRQAVDMTLKGDAQAPLQHNHSGGVTVTHEGTTDDQKMDFLMAFFAAVQETGINPNDVNSQSTEGTDA